MSLGTVLVAVTREAPSPPIIFFIVRPENKAVSKKREEGSRREWRDVNTYL